MLVELFQGPTKRRRSAMAGPDRMAIEEVVRKVLADRTTMCSATACAGWCRS